MLDRFIPGPAVLMPDYARPQKKNHTGFVVIGAGLPRTGTMSLRAIHK